MYGNSSPFASHAQRASNMYNRVGVETDVMTASPHRLVTLLQHEGMDCREAKAVADAFDPRQINKMLE